MWEIWANQLLPKALKSWPKYNKSPNLDTLIVRDQQRDQIGRLFLAFHYSAIGAVGGGQVVSLPSSNLAEDYFIL